MVSGLGLIFVVKLAWGNNFVNNDTAKICIFVKTASNCCRKTLCCALFYLLCDDFHAKNIPPKALKVLWRDVCGSVHP